MLKCLPDQMMLLLILSFTVACCIRRFSFVEGIIDPDRTGLLYRGDTEALAGCMARYLSAPDLAWQHGQAGWHEARRRHSIEAYAARIHEVLRGIRQPRSV